MHPLPPPASQVLLFTVYLLQGRSEYGLQRADEFMQAEIDRQVRRYVVLKTAVCVGVGALIGLIFSLLQLDLAFLIGLITFVANFVPNVGAIFATLLPMPLILLDPAVSVGVRALAFLLPLLVHTTVGDIKDDLVTVVVELRAIHDTLMNNQAVPRQEVRRRLRQLESVVGGRDAALSGAASAAARLVRDAVKAWEGAAHVAHA